MQATFDDTRQPDWLTKWDNEMMAHLASLAREDHPPKMQLLFFANTFPLAYHYSLALRKAGKHPHEHIHVGLWNQTEGYDVYYTNEEADANKKLVTVFNPRWAFVSLTPSTWEIWHATDRSQLPGVSDYAPKARDLSAFLKKAAEANYNRAWIYAELKDLGTLVSVTAEAVFPQPKLFFWESRTGLLPAFEAAGVREDVLRLFVFGGPLSSYLLRKTNRYLPLALPGDLNAGKSLPEEMRLFIVGSDRTPLAPLEEYHASLYGASLGPQQATNQACPPFFTVYRAYNELAWLLQHRSSFNDAKEFGLCLKQHHTVAKD